MVECIVRALKTPESEVPEGSKYLQSVTGRINDNLIYVAQMEVNIVDNDNFTADIYPAVSTTLIKNLINISIHQQDRLLFAGLPTTTGVIHPSIV